MLLNIQDLVASIDGKPILNGVNLSINPGEVHAIMGPNGSGKSTTAKVLAGHPSYEDVGGRVLLAGEDLLSLEPQERSLKGLFLAFQYPVEVPGVNNADFLRLAYNAQRVYRGEPELDPLDFNDLLNAKLSQLEFVGDIFTERAINDGLSGGEKKRNELLQMSLLDPKVAVLDEIDSGLDIDALRLVAAGVNRLIGSHNAVILITHYQRLLNYITPTHVHVMNKGRIVKSGGAELAEFLEREGYEGILPKQEVLSL